ncbi:ribosome small subunit-dependent GTPase A [Pinirhizobacter sp.]|jgi:ribosome biogenesis GTPase|uniref:ribosome small subunit-dependent GTPase A n=1 Tax=Pinirhizobacter sp. TaxID=2950432 RepID=UPI002F3E605F
MYSPVYSLHQLGWCASFAHYLTLDDFEAAYPARVVGAHRSGLSVLSARGQGQVTVPARLIEELEDSIAVGDWVLVEHHADRMYRLIERQSLLTRIAAGSQSQRQSIAANVDTLFVVTSCNDDFNLSRLERYLALAHEAAVEPVLVLTKADLCDDTAGYVAQARDISGAATVLAVNATSASSPSLLAPWLGDGQTVAFVGSSGVGKSTLTNTVIGIHARDTAGIGEDDASGRHTTTSRRMFATATGAWVIDTPGMRELRVGALAHGVQRTFDDIETLADST